MRVFVSSLSSSSSSSLIYMNGYTCPIIRTTTTTTTTNFLFRHRHRRDLLLLLPQNNNNQQQQRLSRCLRRHYCQSTNHLMQWRSDTEYTKRPDNHNHNNHNSNTSYSSYGNALVIGSSGVVGTIMKEYLQNQLQMNVLCADIIHPIASTSASARSSRDQEDFFCLLPTPTMTNNNHNNQTADHDHHSTDDHSTDHQPNPTESSSKSHLTNVTHTLLRSVQDFVSTKSNTKSIHPYLDVIIVASGGYEIDPIPSSSSSSSTTTIMNRSYKQFNTVLQESQQSIDCIEQMYNTNVNPVIAASIVAKYYMNPNGNYTNNTTTTSIPSMNEQDDGNNNSKMRGTLMVVMGATAALQPTPTMLGYGSAKNAVHYYVETLGACTGGTTTSNDIYTSLKDGSTTKRNNNGSNNSSDGASSMIDSKLVRQAGKMVRHQIPSYDHCTVVAILPSMIDTPSNRQSLLQQQQQRSSSNTKNKKNVVNGPITTDDMNELDASIASTLVSPHDIVQEIGIWITNPALRPHSGALIKVVSSIQSQHSNNNQQPPKSRTARFELVR